MFSGLSLTGFWAFFRIFGPWAYFILQLLIDGNFYFFKIDSPHFNRIKNLIYKRYPIEFFIQKILEYISLKTLN